MSYDYYFFCFEFLCLMLFLGDYTSDLEEILDLDQEEVAKNCCWGRRSSKRAEDLVLKILRHRSDATSHPFWIFVSRHLSDQSTLF